VVVWPKTSRRGNKEQWWCRAQKEARLGNGNTAGGLSFYASTGTQQSSKTNWGRDRRSDPAVATRGSRMVVPWGLDDVIVAVGKEMIGRCYDVVPLWHWKGWRSNGLKNWPWRWDRRKEKLAKYFTDPLFACFLIPRIWKVWSTDHGLISNRGLSCLDFSRTLIAHEKLCSYLFNLAGWFD
jgi:hypothetical protein